MTTQIDLNASKCLVTNSAWGEEVITNVCNGVVTRVPWQSMDYIMMFGLITFVAMLCALLIGIAAMVITDMRRCG